MQNNAIYRALRLENYNPEGIYGEIDYLHSDEYEKGTAFSSNENIKISLRIPRKLGATEVNVSFCSGYDGKIITAFQALFEETAYSFDVYSISIENGLLPVGLSFFEIEVIGISHFYGRKKGNLIEFFKEKSNGELFQLTVSDFQYDKPKKNYGGIIYHIFVDRFFCAGNVEPRSDAVLIGDWNSEIPEFPLYPGAFMRNNTFFGGNLFGICEKLDYLNSLGVTTLYLSPIFEAYSNHKYDVGNYMKIDDMFGGEQALEMLIGECKKRGMDIILDGVFNHTGADSIYFNKFNRYPTVGAYQSKESRFYSWYDFQSFPDKYTSWWDIEILPRINPNIKECSDYFIGEGGVIEKYAKMGINGFRLDVADELSDDFIAGIKKKLSEYSEGSILYGEVWEDASNKIAYETRKKYYLGKELDGVMNYPLREGIIDYILNKKIEKLSYAIEVMLNMPKRIRDAAMNLLGTHDTVRILTALGGEPQEGKTNAALCKLRMTEAERSLAIRRLKAAYTVLATLPGIPTIYYGDEAGSEGYSDPFNRRTYPWGKECGELVQHYRKIGTIRRNHSVYREGSFSLKHLDRDLFVFERCDKKRRYLTVFNNSENSINVSFSSSVLCLNEKKKLASLTIHAESAKIFSANSDVSIDFT